jgi:hypothetical protein
MWCDGEKICPSQHIRERASSYRPASSRTNMTLHSLSLAPHDARRTPRLLFHRPATLHVEDGRAASARTVDISMEGLCIQADLALPVNSFATVEFNASYTATPAPLRLRGRVAYCVLAGTAGFRMGLHVTQMDAHAKKQVENILAMQKF